MAITTGDQYIASAKQIIPYTKTATVTSVANIRYTTFTAAGNPAAGTLPATTTPGALYTAGTTGFPSINAMNGTMYLSRVQYNSSVTGIIEIWDKIYGVVGPTATSTTTTTVTSPPSISARVPGGIDYTGVRVFAEITTNLTTATAHTITITYTNQAGVTGRSATTTMGSATLVASRWVELSLAGGDTGVQKIESITNGGTLAAAGVYNIILARQLWRGRVGFAPGGDVHGLDKTGMPQVFPTSALVCLVQADATSTGTPDLNLEISAA
jgi:hypothetical protein